MLMSRSHRFIYLKTTKTAGTSVEALLEPFCAGPGHVVSHHTPTRVSEHGIIGYRGPNAKAEAGAYYNHMGAAKIRERLPEEFAAFHKIAVVRNPYDKCISQFHMQGRLSAAEARAIRDAEPARLKALFSYFARHGLWTDRAILLLDGRPFLDSVIRHEHLAADIAAVSAKLNLGLTDVQSALPSYKTSDRGTAGLSWGDYLDASSRALIEREFSWYFDLFGYDRL